MTDGNSLYRTVTRETKFIEERIRLINMKSRQKVRQEEHERYQVSR